MKRKPVSVCIALGSNIHPEENLPLATKLLSELFQLVTASSVWESAPFGFSEQPSFLNAAIELRTSRSITQIKQTLLDIESRLGRVRDPHNVNGPRTIDLDIALYGEDCTIAGNIEVPDPDILCRPFLAIPLAELGFERNHPVEKLSLGEIARKMGGIRELTLRPDVQLIAGQHSDIQELQKLFN